MYTKSRCIIIKAMDFRDADKLVTIFSEQKGKVRTVARGTKKPNSSLRACVQLFAHSFLSFTQRRELGTITQGRVLDFYGNIRDNLELSLSAVYIMELLDKSLLENAPLPRLYYTTLQVLNILNTEEIDYNPLLIRYYEMSLLTELGYKPILNYCIVCRSTDGLNHISISHGGTICSKCSNQNRYNIYISGESLAILKMLMNANISTLFRLKPSPRAMQEIELVLEKYLEYHLERKFNVKNTVKQLKERLAFPN